MYKQLDLNFEEPKDEVRYDNLLMEPETLRKEVEFANVQRVFEESKAFAFSAPNKVTTPRDVAYIFKQLETVAVENTFAVLVKDDQPTVIHLGMGSSKACLAPFEPVIAADKKINADKIYLVHNHPSGNVQASREDMALLNQWERIFGNRMQPGIIINTRTGVFGEFVDGEQVKSDLTIEPGQRLYPVKLYSFSKLVFSKDYKETGIVANSSDVAAFLSGQRLGERSKLAYLILGRNGTIQANIHTNYDCVRREKVKDLARQIAEDSIAFGGQQVITYGTAQVDRLRIKELQDELYWRGVLMQDHVSIRLDDGSLANSLMAESGSMDRLYKYQSANNEGWLSSLMEPEIGYGEERKYGQLALSFDEPEEEVQYDPSVSAGIREDRINRGIMTEEEYLGLKGYSAMGYAELALHKGRQKTQGAQDRVVKNYHERARAYDEERVRLRLEYREKAGRGELRAPTPAEQIIEQANGNPDSAATQAARRSAEKRGIDWRVQKKEKIVDVNRRFNQELQLQINGGLPKGHIYRLGRPSQTLKGAGIPDLPIEMVASRLSDKSMQDNHPFDLSEVQNLVTAIQNPLAVFRSATHIGSNVILTELNHHGKNFVVAIQTNQKKGRIEINSIRSVYPKNNIAIVHWIKDNLADYLDKKRMAEWLSKQRSNSADVRKLFDHATKLVQSFENAKEEQEIRFRFIGEKGAANLDKAEEATTRLDNLAVAEEMEAAKKDAVAIKMATGWERGADGKWRYEEPDFEVDIKGLARKNHLYDDLPWGKEYNALIDKIFDGVELTPRENVRFEELSVRADELRKVYEAGDIRYLDDYVKDKKLFEAYPKLKQVRLEMYEDPKDNGVLYTGATWYAGQNLIRVNEQTLSNEGFRSVLVHEVQHAIQEMEGFARGGNRNTYRNHLDSLKEKHDAWSMLEEFDRKRKELGEEAFPMEVYYAVRDEYRSLGFEFGDGVFPSREAYDKGFNLWVRGYDKEGYEEAYNEYQSLTGKFGHGLGDDRYRQISGEVESRNVQSRIDMTPEQRRASLASETEDVARDKQIMIEAREQVRDLSAKLHTPIRVIKSDDIHHNDKDMEKRMRAGKGWYNTRMDEVMLVLDNQSSMEDLKKTVLHEVVGHKGLREIMGEKTFKTMCESVYRSMNPAVQQSYLRQYGTPAIAGEEFIAHAAEHGTTASMWQAITSALKVALNSMGIHVNYTYREVAALLQRSRRHLENKQTAMQPSVRPVSGEKKQTAKPRKRGRGI
ncbi:MAG: hypothetical protein NC048_02555 [Bacteroides sp.]|nr:hypothetical protein [Bacteroides sp.]MCM1531480.1 hypothetical protein [Ruminococcus flavefaciens]MCM1554358.1 hypothetical protein [Bacteroides sp.]